MQPPAGSETKKGLVLEIQRMSTEDGPGIRTTVFFKGCTLRCAWCHNPESISPKPEAQWTGSRCIGCGTCRDVCPNGALGFDPDGVVIDRSRCIGCGTCTEACPSTALEILGRYWTVDGLVREVVKDRAYFEKSGGGVTASGGEVTLQVAFAAEFLKGCRNEGLHTAVDTCGCCPWVSLEQLLPLADLVLFDLKLMDPARHRDLTGQDNKRILENLVHVREWMTFSPAPPRLWIRTPVIPNATDSVENILETGRFIAGNLRGIVQRWDLCAFNNLCRDKYQRLDLDWAFRDASLITAPAMENLADAARRSGVDPGIVHWSGSTRIDEPVPQGSKNRPVLHLASRD